MNQQSMIKRKITFLWYLNSILDNDLVFYHFSRRFCSFGTFAYEFSSFKYIVLISSDLSVLKYMVFHLCLHLNFRFEA